MQPTDQDRPPTDNTTDERIPRRVSVPEAALLLGISEDAVRSRLRRGTLRKEKGTDGTVYVILNGAARADRPPTGADQPSTDADQPTTDHATDRADALGMIELMRDQVEHLRGQLDAEREANRENRRIIAALVGRVPELEAKAPAEPSPAQPDQPTASSSEADRGTVRDDSRAASEGRTEPRSSWWRRLFGLDV